MEINKKVEVIRQHGEFHRVVPFDPVHDTLARIDLAGKDPDLSGELLADTRRFTAAIMEKIAVAHARYGIGGYGEKREVYAASTLFNGGVDSEEPRRFHLGTDIWGKRDTPVMVPLEGLVHSFANNDQPGDYGATIILCHNIGGISFYSLYGHLSLRSISNLQEGQRVEAGEIIGEFGIPSENGHWPPHLHFQLILDMQGRKGDYPGVCRASESRTWLENSPDPELILQLNRYIK